jgi:hypothetical protein
MTHYEKQQQRIKDKFGIEKLEVSPVNPKEPINLTPNLTADEIHYRNHMRKLEEKYGMTQLSLNGLPERTEATTLAEHVRQRDISEQQRYRFCVATTSHQGKKLNIFYSVGR